YDAPQEVVVPLPEKQVPIVLNSLIESSLQKQTTNVHESDQLNCKPKETSFREPAKKRPATLKRTQNVNFQVRYYAPHEVVTSVPEKQVLAVSNTPSKSWLLKQSTNLHETDQWNYKSEKASFWEPAEIELTEQELASQIVTAIAKRGPMKVEESVELLHRLGAFKNVERWDQQFEIPMNESFYESSEENECEKQNELITHGKKRGLESVDGSDKEIPVFKRLVGHLGLHGSTQQEIIGTKVPADCQAGKHNESGKAQAKKVDMTVNVTLVMAETMKASILEDSPRKEMVASRKRNRNTNDDEDEIDEQHS
ncbi:hypothetical protein HK096_000032, partial [Nowakowskiella sp. JEL0078]